MLKHRWFRLGSLGILLLVPLLLGGCSFVELQSTLDPQGPIARQQMSLLTWTMWLSTIVIIGVAVVLFGSIIRYRAKADDDSLPAQSHGNTIVEIGLILLATFITIIVVVPAVRTIFRTEFHVTPTEEDIVIDVWVISGGGPLTIQS